ncbi:MAG: ATPase, T2SS/T4P/T4SS family [Syntrophobacteraceae bacterium]
MRSKKKLGEMLVEAGLLSEEKLKGTLGEFSKSGLKLGQYLIRQGLVSEGSIIDMLSRQLEIEKYHPDGFPLDLRLSDTIPYDLAMKHQCVPLRRKARLLTVGMVDPMDIEALDAIEVTSNLEVEPVICTERTLNQLMDSLYRTQSGLGTVMETIEEMQIEESPSETTEESGDKDLQVDTLKDMADEAPVIRLVNSIVSQAVREGASDIHISPEHSFATIRFRIDGKLHEMPAPPKSMLMPIVSRVKILAGMDISTLRLPQDGRFTVKMEKKEINIRASTVPTIHGENLVLRLLDMSSGHYTLDRLGVSTEDMERIENGIKKPYGMILSTGPTGSGKSTSLYAILRKLNSSDVNIITLEDPIEYRVEKIRQIQLNRRAGMTFASGLRAILRQDPDIILVGEIRDAETAGIAVQAAMTGHRVLSTVHTNDAAGAITRFIDMGIEPFLVASVLIISFAQRLVRTICPYCKEPYAPPRELLMRFGLENDEDATFMRGKGCFNCMNTGYKGRIGIFEILFNDEMIQDMVLKRNSAQEITRAAVNAGKLRTLRDDAILKVKQGLTTFEEAMSAVVV